jgi:hypothetical protein
MSSRFGAASTTFQINFFIKKYLSLAGGSLGS